VVDLLTERTCLDEASDEDDDPTHPPEVVLPFDLFSVERIHPVYFVTVVATLAAIEPSIILRWLLRLVLRRSDVSHVQ